jgi:hypothetical protein
MANEDPCHDGKAPLVVFVPGDAPDVDPEQAGEQAEREEHDGHQGEDVHAPVHRLGQTSSRWDQTVAIGAHTAMSQAVLTSPPGS